MSRVLRLITAGFLVAAATVAHGQPLPKADVPNLSSLPILQVQANDQANRIIQLEEQNRILTGRLEELGFQMLQMQEQMRQMQEDNEFRFQDLERSNSSDQTSVAPKASRPATDLTKDNDQSSTASVSSDQESELYKAGYAKVLAGDYSAAADTFRSYLSQFPTGADAANANFWLGESLYTQGEFREAARIFLDGHKAYPDSAKAPDTLLKLGMSLVALDNRETACATYDEVLARYPTSSKAVKDKVASERSRANC